MKFIIPSPGIHVKPLNKITHQNIDGYNSVKNLSVPQVSKNPIFDFGESDFGYYGEEKLEKVNTKILIHQLLVNY